MTEEEKKLLLKDLCTRELYHPMIHVFNDGYEGFQNGEFDTNLWFHHIDAFRFDRIEILPYLRTMSSMTDEELKGFRACRCVYDLHPDFHPMMCNIANEQNMFDWLNANHFDLRGLIGRGLALQAPEDMYKI